MLILDNYSNAIFSAEEAWYEHCKENNIEDPVQKLIELEEEKEQITEMEDAVEEAPAMAEECFENRIDYYEPQRGRAYRQDPFQAYGEKYKAFKQYKKIYSATKNLWIGNYLLQNFGYDVLSNFAQTHSSDEALLTWFNAVHPCDGFNGQCSIFCSIFGTCDFKENN